MIARRLILIYFALGCFLFSAVEVNSAAAQSTVDDALTILQTSLNHRTREKAFSFLSDQDQLPASAALPLGQLIFQGGRDAKRASSVLSLVGDDSIPILTELLQDSDLDIAIRCTWTIKKLNKPDATRFLDAVLPLLHSEDRNTRYRAAMALGAFPFDRDTAIKVAEEMLAARFYPPRFVAAVTILPQTQYVIGENGLPNEEQLLELDKSTLAFLRYAGARNREDARRWRYRGLKVSPNPITPAEAERREEMDKQLQSLATDAVTECLKFYREGDDTCKWIVLQSLKFMSPHAKSELGKIFKTLQSAHIQQSDLLQHSIRHL